MKEWSKMTNTEIRMNLDSMKMEYEAIKNKINHLFNELDMLDNEYIRGQKVLEERTRK